MNNHLNSNHDDALERETRAYHSKSVPDGPPSEFVAQVLAALHHAEEAANQPTAINLKQRILVMKAKTKIAFAATVLIAFGGLLAWLMQGQGTALAFEDLVQPILEAKSATFTSTTEGEGQPPLTCKGMVLEPNRFRQEMPGGRVGIVDFDQQKMLMLNTNAKVAVVADLADMPKPPASFFERFRMLLPGEADDAGVERKALGESEIDGKRAIGYRVTRRDETWTIWGDPDTQLPIRVEASWKMSDKSMTVTMTDFVFNVDLDESLFSVEPPADYTVPSAQAGATPTEEQD